MKADFLNSTYFAVIIILVIMAIGLREIFLGPLWGIIPVGLGFLWMLAGMRNLGIDFNFANIVISSILIGNGVDYAVYVLHSYAHTRSIEKTMSETAAPVLGSAVTTMVSFGSLLFANTPGLQVFGTSALLGVGCTTFFTLVFLPALLALRSRD
jgi:predicted RND superfamily exporter protein